MGRDGPSLRAEGYGIGVTGKRDGRLVPGATDACDKIRAAFVERHRLALEVGFGQQARQMIGARRLLAGGLMVSKRINSAARSTALSDI